MKKSLTYIIGILPLTCPLFVVGEDTVAKQADKTVEAPDRPLPKKMSLNLRIKSSIPGTRRMSIYLNDQLIENRGRKNFPVRYGHNVFVFAVRVKVNKGENRLAIKLAPGKGQVKSKRTTKISFSLTDPRKVTTDDVGRNYYIRYRYQYVVKAGEAVGPYNETFTYPKAITLKPIKFVGGEERTTLCKGYYTRELSLVRKMSTGRYGNYGLKKAYSQLRNRQTHYINMCRTANEKQLAHIKRRIMGMQRTSRMFR